MRHPWSIGGAIQVTIDVPEVGGKLILVDMAGSENIDQAGLGRELKMQVMMPTWM